MKFIFALLVSTLSATAMAGTPGYTGPKDMADSCASAVITKLQGDTEVSSYLDDSMVVNLDWWDSEKTEIAFTFNFSEDARDGYMTGQVAVTMQQDGSCQVGEIVNTSVGD